MSQSCGVECRLRLVDREIEDVERCMTRLLRKKHDELNIAMLQSMARKREMLLMARTTYSKFL
jgi:hypothetical protein